MQFSRERKIGVGIITYDFPEQVKWWATQLKAWGSRIVPVISTSDDHSIDTDIAVVRGPNLGVAHAKNRALRYLYAAGCDPIVLIEDDAQTTSWPFFKQLQNLASAGIDHLMLGPIDEHHTWRYTGQTRHYAGYLLREYERTREPQDTPGVVTMVTRRALDAVGGLHPGFVGRGHAHGEWTERIERVLPSPLGSQFWALETYGALHYVDPPKRNVTHDQNRIQLNANRRDILRAIGWRGPHLGYLGPTPFREEPISVCISLKNRASMLRRCLDSIAAWFDAEKDTPNEVVIADFGSDDCDVEQELSSRGLRGRVVRMPGYFSRSCGLDAAAESAANDLLFFLDADMTVAPTIGDAVRRLVRPGKCLFPICWSLNEDGQTGYWRHRGYGMLAIHRADYDLTGGWDTSNARWGGEDNDIHWHAQQRGIETERLCLSTLVHQWHPESLEYKEAHMDPSATSWGSRWVPPDRRDAVLSPKRMRIEPVVMGIKERAQSATELSHDLNCAVSWDDPPVSPWHNARRCWLGCPEDATHRLLVNDDAVLCPSFYEAVYAAVAARPNGIISFFTVRPEINNAAVAGRPWMVYNRNICGVALCMPRWLIKDFVAWCDENLNPDWHSADTRLLVWAHATGRDILYTVPSLVQHNEEHVSTIHHESNRGHVSTQFAEHGAKGVDWSKPPYIAERTVPEGYWEAHSEWFREGVDIREAMKLSIEKPKGKVETTVRAMSWAQLQEYLDQQLGSAGSLRVQQELLKRGGDCNRFRIHEPLEGAK